MGCFIILIIYVILVGLGFAILGPVGAIIGFILASVIVAKLNSN